MKADGLRYILTLGGILCAVSVAAGDFAPNVNSDGQISLPTADVLKDWAMLGVWAHDGEDEVAEIHTVYITTEAIEAYLKDGSFADGTVIVKELRATRTQDMTTGRVSHLAGLNGWFVMVKDTEARFPDNPLWGEGWGWAYFDASDPSATTTEDYEAECLSCHVPAQETDWIYVEGYPVLNR